MGGANWSKSTVFMKTMVSAKTVDFEVEIHGFWLKTVDIIVKICGFHENCSFGQKPRILKVVDEDNWSKSVVFMKTLVFSQNHSFSRFCVTFKFKTKVVFQNFMFGPKTIVFVVFCTQLTPFKTI